jgi:hypothetical protein
MRRGVMTGWTDKTDGEYMREGDTGVKGKRNG